MINTTLRLAEPIGTIATQRLFEIIGLVGVLKIVTGTWLNWKIMWLRSDAEEAVKDGKLTEKAARARIHFFGWFFPGLIVAGIGLLALAMYGLSQTD